MTEEQALTNALINQRNDAQNQSALLFAKLAVMEQEKVAQQEVVSELEKQLSKQGEDADKIEMKLNDTVTALTNKVHKLKGTTVIGNKVKPIAYPAS